MISELEIFYSLLEALTPVPIYYEYPNNFATIPCISYRQIADNQTFQTLDKTTRNIIQFSVQVWGETLEEINTLESKLTVWLLNANYVKSFDSDLRSPVDKYYKKELRYEITKYS